jgi:hypothetical protein
MDEVKAREEEYDTIKMVSTRLHGLPFADKLARRERRLLIRGEVECVTPGMTSAYVFVFTDVLLIAQAFEDEGESWWCHDERQGVARLLEVVHIGSAGKHAYVFYDSESDLMVTQIRLHVTSLPYHWMTLRTALCHRRRVSLR